MDKISIIIPVYNVDAYISKCLDSVINQTYTNLEIFCIVNGSTDNSGKICDEYAKKDKRIKVFHQAKRGVSCAKNIALKHMTGKYVGFADSDDWLEPDMYEVLYNAINDKGVSISIAGYFKDTDTETMPAINKEQISNDIISTKNMLLYPLKRDYYMGFCGYMWNKLFAAEIFRNSNLVFDEKIRYGEDILLYTSLVSENKCTGVYTDKQLYHYYQRKSAVTKTELLDIRIDVLTVYKRIEELLNSGGYSDIGYWAGGFYCHHASVIAEIALNNNDEKTLSRMQDEIKKHLNDYIKTNMEFPEKIDRIYKLLRANSKRP